MPEALGHAPDGGLPGMLVRPGDPAALAAALAAGSATPGCAAGCGGRRSPGATTLTGWAVTTAPLAGVAEGGGGMTPRMTLPFAEWLRAAGARRRGGARRASWSTPSAPALAGDARR